MLTQKDIKEFENKFLAPYAMKSSESRGRAHKEEEHSYRSAYQRDRDRVIHSAAFRRLEYKTQVFVNHEGDYYRTRLTHTLEVSQIARTIATALGLNVDLVEAIALAHDLGHTPFGHSGEDALNELMAQFGGFNHNVHGLRVVDILEERYPEFPGLNLSWEVREGIAKHSSAFDQMGSLKEFDTGEQVTLETQVVDIADEIAYDNHDLDDGLTSGLLKEADLESLELWNDTYQKVTAKYPGLDAEKIKFQVIKSLIDVQVTDLIHQTEESLKKLGVDSWEKAKKIDKKVVSFSKDMLELRKPLRGFLMERLYCHYRVVRMANKAKRFIEELFKIYVEKPQQLPPHIHIRIKKEFVQRVVCDYIAGMTDRYALDEYKKLFDPYEKV
ncbi:MAG: deoxyguanosinetriphosphate triphosphohydrolase [Candidatus Omnitrophica bacterium]|nr:deoxyguanosinetriphosphate triphosphohydrolase [Candidatus Omnitrophota bacterium]MDD5655006.1 deoxyguanosinetriphosphate triphosphohydrolase [Candidatus Omnitrophota bacterium]